MPRLLPVDAGVTGLGIAAADVPAGRADAQVERVPGRLVLVKATGHFLLAGRVEDALGILEAAAPLGWSGGAHPGPVVVPYLLIAATGPEIRPELLTAVGPLPAPDEAEPLLAQELDSVDRDSWIAVVDALADFDDDAEDERAISHSTTATARFPLRSACPRTCSGSRSASCGAAGGNGSAGSRLPRVSSSSGSRRSSPPSTAARTSARRGSRSRAGRRSRSRATTVRAPRSSARSVAGSRGTTRSATNSTAPRRTRLCCRPRRTPKDGECGAPEGARPQPAAVRFRPFHPVCVIA